MGVSLGAERHTRQLQLHHDHVNQGGDRWATGLDDEVRGFPVERIAQRVQVTQTRQRVGDLQQRSVHVMAQAPEQLVGRGVEVHHPATLAQMLAVGRP